VLNRAKSIGPEAEEVDRGRPTDRRTKRQIMIGRYGFNIASWI